MFVQYQTFDYPHASSLNPRLYEIVHKNYNQSHGVSGGAYRTWQDLHTRGIKDVDKLLLWIENLIPQCARTYADQIFLDNSDKGSRLGGSGGFISTSLKIHSCWGIHYSKGNSVVKHNHFPYAMSFVYCVSTSDKSSPLIIEGERINLVPGRVIFFLSHQYHWVPLNKCDRRCSIVGNILYTP